MKSPRVLIAIALLLLAVGWTIWDRFSMISPTPETESAFLKNYDPTDVMKRFNDGRGVSGSDRGSAAGRNSVTHTAGFRGDFSLCSDKFVSLMDALRDDVSAQLAGNGAQILSQIGEARAGFRFDYKLGKTVGSVSIPPLELTPGFEDTRAGIRPHANCTVDVHTSIDVAEKWFPKEPGLMRVSVNELNR